MWRFLKPAVKVLGIDYFYYKHEKVGLSEDIIGRVFHNLQKHLEKPGSFHDTIYEALNMKII